MDNGPGPCEDKTLQCVCAFPSQVGPADGDVRDMHTNDQYNTPCRTLVCACTTDVQPLFHHSIWSINCKHPQMLHMNAEASEGIVWIVWQKCDLEYFVHEVQHSVDCHSIYKEPVQWPERQSITWVWSPTLPTLSLSCTQCKLTHRVSLHLS